MNQKRPFLLLFLCSLLLNLKAQQLISPLYVNAELKSFNSLHPNIDKAYGIKHTLSKTNSAFDSLPFFEDFTTSKIVPDTNHWLDHNVFINNGFPINPPSYNVATFDGLDKIGNAYALSVGGSYGPADTLTSIPLNLSKYVASDNIFFSFFYEMRGRGDMPQTEDSLLLQFLTSGGKWNTVWVKSGGQSDSTFTQVIFSVNNTIYLHGAFQFRFVNFASYSGNWNQWHVDYIRLDRSRTIKDTLSTDVAIMTSPTPLLKRYYSMPWNQYKASTSIENASSTSFFVRNLKNTNVQVPSKYFVFNKQYNNLINNDAFLLGSLTYQIPQKISYNFATVIDTISPKDDSVIIKSIYTASEVSDAHRMNDTFYKEQLFANYYAYDDGTAENGFGILNGSGKVALGFESNLGDTLRAIDIYFNQSSTQNSGINFTLTAWSYLTPIGKNTNEDIKIHSQTVMVPVHDYSYRDQMGGFTRFLLDTPRYIPAGKFYIGWVQNSSFQLNVGYDMNYPGNFGTPYNPNVFVNTLGSWMISGTVPGFTGTPMLRPIIGKQPTTIVNGLATKETNFEKLYVYPNPAQYLINIKIAGLEKATIKITDIQGRTRKEIPYESSAIDVHELGSGVYFLTLIDQLTNLTYNTKFIIQ